MVAQRAAIASTQVRVFQVRTGGRPMTLSEAMGRAGVRSTHFYVTSVASIGLCIGLWIRAKTVDQDERGNAERRALFVGLWPPMFWLMGDSLKATE
jgi:hypothetical protein